MSGKSIDTNLRSAFAHLQIANAGMSPMVMVSIDIEKAFDSIDWQFMQVVLELMGFGPKFQRWITLLYSTPQVAIGLGLAVSPFLNMGQGTRQGRPLSPFLFALVMEPLATALRMSRPSGAIQVGSISEWINEQHADYFILFS